MGYWLMDIKIPRFNRNQRGMLLSCLTSLPFIGFKLSKTTNKRRLFNGFRHVFKDSYLNSIDAMMAIMV